MGPRSATPIKRRRYPRGFCLLKGTSIKSQADDFPGRIDKDVETAIAVGIKCSSFIRLRRLDVGAPELSAVAPCQLPWVGEDSAKKPGVFGEVQLDLTVAAGRVRVGVDTAVLRVIVVEDDALAE